MNQERFEEFLREAARSYHSPPETPREEMWARIEAVRRGNVFQRRRIHRRTWIQWGMGIAAVLLVGIGLGRLSVRPESPETPVTTTAPSADNSSALAYRMAAAQHLSQAEMLLTSFPSEAGAEQPNAQIGSWARDLLSNTRLLLDSPAAEDPQLRVLLQDLELILAQISQLPAGAEGGGEELDLVQQAINEGDVLPRLRTTIPAGTPLVDI